MSKKYTLPPLTEEEQSRILPLRKLYSSLTNLFIDEKGTINDKGYFSAIPSGHHVVPLIAQLKLLFPKDENPKFLDVGSGKGNIIALAGALGFHSKGIEYREEYKPSVPWDMFFGDAFDFPHYAEYDVIYMFCPIADVDKMQKLMDLASKKAKIGAILVFMGCSHMLTSYAIKKLSPFKHQEFQMVWIKVKK